jgi:anti-sigma B factor antagonist
VSYPRRNLALIALGGELDLCTVERLRDVLDPRLDTVVDTVVLDLSQLTFLAVTGLDLLCRSRARAVAAGIDLRVVVAGREVARPLRITGLDRLLTCYPTVAMAVDPAGD